MTELIHLDYKQGIPLVGLLQIGVIDRGSTMLQVRATTCCNMRCTFCSTSANSLELHGCNFEADLEYLLAWVKEVIRLKNDTVTEINLDSVGEPSAYPKIVELIQELKKLPTIQWISMQCNGTLLTEALIKKLEGAGLKRLNLSMHALMPEQAQYLFGSKGYNLDRVLAAARIVAQSSIELNLTPVYLPGINDEQIPELIKLSKELKCRISIQKYEEYRFSLKEKKAKPTNWYKFYRKLEEWEKEYGVKLKLGPTDFNVHRSKKIPLLFQENELVAGVVLAPGWLPHEAILAAKDRAITVVHCDKKIGQTIKAKIIETKNSIYLAKEV